MVRCVAELHPAVQAECVSGRSADDARKAVVRIELAWGIGADEFERSGGSVRFIEAALSRDSRDQLSVCADGDRLGEAAGAWDGSEPSGDAVCDEAEYQACDCG